MNFLVDHVDQSTIILFAGSRFDASLAPEFKTVIGDTIEAGASSLILDMRNVEFIDSSALGAIISVYKVLNESGDLSMINVGTIVRSVFTLTHLDRVFDLNQVSDDFVDKSAA